MSTDIHKFWWSSILFYISHTESLDCFFLQLSWSCFVLNHKVKFALISSICGNFVCFCGPTHSQ